MLSSCSTNWQERESSWEVGIFSLSLNSSAHLEKDILEVMSTQASGSGGPPDGRRPRKDKALMYPSYMRDPDFLFDRDGLCPICWHDRSLHTISQCRHQLLELTCNALRCKIMKHCERCRDCKRRDEREKKEAKEAAKKAKKEQRRARRNGDPGASSSGAGASSSGQATAM